MQPRQRFLFMLPLATGAGLLVYALSGISLPIAIAAAACIGLVAALVAWRKSTPTARRILKRRAVAGAVAGLAATFAYDLTRYLVVRVFSLSLWPFDVFPIFGRLLLGSGSSHRTVVIVGWLYHIANGCGFGVAFMFLFRRPSVLYALLWAAFLELCMVSIYPGWLKPKALDEFLSISVVGHAAYGLVLGLSTSYSRGLYEVERT